MHEMSIALQIIKIVSSAIPANIDQPTVEQIDLKVGKFSAVIPESLRFCFKIAAADTPCAGAELKIEEIPVVVQCRSCKHKREVDKPIFVCENCSNGSVEIVSGRELNVESIRIAD